MVALRLQWNKLRCGEMRKATTRYRTVIYFDGNELEETILREDRDDDLVTSLRVIIE
jgi:hypothetical protein